MPIEAESGEEWTPDRIRELRENDYDETQAEFGQRIFAASPGYAQFRVSQLESGDIRPSAAVVKHLNRLDSAK